MRTLAVCVFGVVLAAGAAALAQDDGGITIEIRGATLSQAVAQISKAADATILIDGTISRSGIQLSVVEAPVEVALSAVCAPHELAWKRLYIKPEPQKKLKGEEVGDLVRTLESVKDLGLVATDGTTKLSTVYQREAKLTGDDLAPYAKPDSGYQLVYLIVDLKPKPKPKETDEASEGRAQTPIDTVITRDRETMDMLLRLTPQQLDEYWSRQADLFVTLDPEMQVGFLTMGIRSFLRMEPQDAQQLFFEAISRLTPEEMERLRGMGGPPPEPPDF